MPETNALWESVNGLRDAQTEIKVALAQITENGKHRDATLDAIGARLSAIDARLSALAATVGEARALGRFALLAGRIGWGALAATSAVVGAHWQTIKRWLP